MARLRPTGNIPPDVTPPLAWIPTRLFMVSGTGVHDQERVAVQKAMREAGVADCNLLKVSSVIAPGITIISREEGLKLIRPGNILTAVIANAQTQEPHQRVTAALAWAKPDMAGVPGYIAELEEELAKGKSEATATAQVGQEALHLMANRMRITVDAERLWKSRGRGRTVRMAGTTVHVGALSATAVGPEMQNDTARTAAAFVAAIYI